MATRVYSYGGKTPIRGLKEIGEQMELARSYYNELIAMERQRRLDYRERCRTQSPELVDLALMIEGCVGVKIDAKAQAGEEPQPADDPEPDPTPPPKKPAAKPPVKPIGKKR
jgi:hypothetical protein